MTDDEVRVLLRSRCAFAGGQKAWAAQHGFSATYVSDVIKGRRPVSEQIAAALGLVLKKDWVNVADIGDIMEYVPDENEKGGE